MFRNHIHPISLFAILVMAIATLCLGIAGEIYYEQVRYSDRAYYTGSSWRTDELLAFCVFLGIAFFWIVGGIGFVLRKNWARLLLQIGFAIGGIIWLVFLTYNFSDLRRNPFVFGGITAAILGLVTGALLFLSNSQLVLPYFVKDPGLERIRSHLLDDDLLEEQGVERD